MPRFLLLSLVLVLAVAAPASAVESEMIGTPNFSHVKNFQYEQRYDSGANAGSDIEFMDITLKAAQVQSAPPAGQTQPAVKKASRKRYNACVKKAKKRKGKARKAALRKCRKYLPKAKRSAADVDAGTPGVQRTFAFAGTYYNGLQIADVSDPENVTMLPSYDCGIAQGDVQVFRRPDLGKVFVGYGADDPYANNPDSACYKEVEKLGFSTDKANSGTFFIDVTDPYKPHAVSFLPFEKGSHNLTIHPSGKYLYNSNSDTLGTSGFGIEVADISDITKPKQITTIPLDFRPGLGSESHDIYFSPDGKRAYSAAVSEGVIINTEDPAKPTVISSIFDPAVNVWHQAETVESDVPGAGKRTLLIAADEFAGATPTGQCPNGGLHIYDVTGDLEKAPVKLGYWNFSDTRATDDMRGCTAHVYQLFRDQNIMSIANYNGGVHVLDYSSIWGLGAGANSTGIKELGNARFTDSDTWAVKSPKFNSKGVSYLFGNDEVRGLDVYRFDATK